MHAHGSDDRYRRRKLPPPLSSVSRPQASYLQHHSSPLPQTPPSHCSQPPPSDSPLALLPTSPYSSQDPPLKKGFKIAHVAPAPYSMFLTEPHVEAGPGGVGLRDTKVGTEGGKGARECLRDTKVGREGGKEGSKGVWRVPMRLTPVQVDRRGEASAMVVPMDHGNSLY